LRLLSSCVCASQATWAALPDDTAPLQYAASVLAEARGEAVDEDSQLVNVAVRAMADHCRTRAAADWEVRPRDTPAACGLRPRDTPAACCLLAYCLPPAAGPLINATPSTATALRNVCRVRRSRRTR